MAHHSDDVMQNPFGRESNYSSSVSGVVEVQ